MTLAGWGYATVTCGGGGAGRGGADRKHPPRTAVKTTQRTLCGNTAPAHAARGLARERSAYFCRRMISIQYCMLLMNLAELTVGTTASAAPVRSKSRSRRHRESPRPERPDS